ncbi:MAG: CBS domain-containing protein, partial [Hyphomicrobiaceae bacterium]
NVAMILNEKGRDVVVHMAGTAITDVVRDLSQKGIGASVVTDEGDRVIGIVSERDIMRAIADSGAGCLDQPVSTIMTRNVATCTEHDTVTDIMTKMTEGRFRHMPVVNSERLVGIVSIGDVVKNHIAEVEMEANALRTYVAG